MHCQTIRPPELHVTASQCQCEYNAASEMNYEVLMKVCLILILSLNNYASTFELNNEMSVYDSYGDNVKQFISKVQNFEQNKILQNGEDKLHDMQIRAEGTTRGNRRKRRRKKKRKSTANYPAMHHPISSLEMSKITKFIKSVCRTTRSREVSKYCNENLRQ